MVHIFPPIVSLIVIYFVKKVLVDKNMMCKLTDFGLSIQKKNRVKPADLKSKYGINMDLEEKMHGKTHSYIEPVKQPVGVRNFRNFPDFGNFRI